MRREVEVDRTDYAGPTVRVGGTADLEVYRVAAAEALAERDEWRGAAIARAADLDRMGRRLDRSEQVRAELEAELARMRPVYDAAIAWRRSHGSSVDVIVDGRRANTISADERALRIVVDRAIEATP